MFFNEIGQIFGLFTSIAIISKTVSDFFRQKRAEDRLDAAEKQAFRTDAESQVSPSTEDQASVSKRESKPLSMDERYGEIERSNLFNLYNRQIEKYQTQTQARAGWSFIFAIVSMLSGLGLLVWEGSQIIQTGSEHAAAGVLVASIGSAVSAFITKTFLDVHRLSLVQLNHYFSQPVLNAHVLMAQRLADQLHEDTARQKAYEDIIEKVSSLIATENAPTIDIYGRPIARKNSSQMTKSKRRTSKQEN